MTVNIFPARKDGADDRLEFFFKIMGIIVSELVFICFIGWVVL